MKHIHIIGGGLSGLTLGILLRQRGVPVTVSEAGQYPRHRVCGEFISGRGLGVLRELGLCDTFADCGGVAATTAAFFSGDRMLGRRGLPSPALCVSRWVLDAKLAEMFVATGGELRTGLRLELQTGEGTVLATGRRSQPVDEDGARWFGLKVHARGIELEADLEMHVQRDAYIGVCRISEDEVNVCGLFRRERSAPQVSIELLRGADGSALSEKLCRAEFERESFCAVAGLCLDPLPLNPEVCRVGDAITMIPPITGNGMSLAFESAALTADPLAEFARGGRPWSDATRLIAATLQRAFGSRLKWAKYLHRALFNDVARECFLPALARTGAGWQLAYALTRQ